MDQSKLKRNKLNNAVLNTDSVSFQKYISERQQSREVKEALQQVGTLRRDVDDIKDMLRTLINGMNKNG